ncbi:MAG: HYR domain-containing protein [Saprospiraceae bacterium]|nr:HYR domain-containing protein [Saprospiraceae bacterium]
MKSYFTLLVSLIGLLMVASTAIGFVNGAPRGVDPSKLRISEQGNLCFIENKGQVVDQNRKLRPDVLFSGTDGNLVFHLKRTGISYQISEVKTWKNLRSSKSKIFFGAETKVPDEYMIHRIDVNWVNPNEDIRFGKDEMMSNNTQYYLAGGSKNATKVGEYKGAWIYNIYNKIDAHFYTSNEKLKVDYKVAPGGNYKQLAWEINGASAIVDPAGNLAMITAAGVVEEGRPLVYQNSKMLKAQWVLNGNKLSLAIEGIDPTKELMIDPLVRSWGTYYGGNNDDQITACSKDANGDLYVCGITATTTGTVIATTGSHQQTFGGGTQDGFVAKFNPAGTRIWATYYGGSEYDYAWGIANDGTDIYVVGETSSSDLGAISTVGTQQSTFGGDVDAYLIRFNSAGVRTWGTYYGDTGQDYGFAVAVGTNNQPVIVGETNTFAGTAIASPGSHQPSYGGALFDAFVAQFNPAGVRNWGTYYGGSDNEAAYGVSVNVLNWVLFTGQTATFPGTEIATAVSHQPIYGGGNTDAYFAVLDMDGVRQFGSYYGGTGDESGFDICQDINGDIIVVGASSTNTGTSIATTGSHQDAYAGGTYDGFIANFDFTGSRQWGTYYGGSGEDVLFSCDIDALDTIFVSGRTSSNAGIATSNAYDNTYSGTQDAYFAKFNPDGAQNYGSYYGGSGSDVSYGICIFPNATLYIVGTTETPTDASITSVGSHQSAFGGGTNDGFIAKIFDCETPIINAVADNIQCSGVVSNAITFSSRNISGATFKWLKLSSPAGQATNLNASGFGNLPSFTYTNSTCVVLVDTIIVTPIHKVNAVDSCLGIPDTFLLRSIPVVEMDDIRDSSFCHGQSWLPPAFDDDCVDSLVFHWVKKSGPGGTTLPGLASSGSGNLPSLNIVNPPPSCLILTDTIIVTPYYKTKYSTDSCKGVGISLIVKSVPTPVVTATRDTVYCTGSTPAGINFTTTCSVGTVIRWTKTSLGGPGNAATNIPLSGTGNISSFTSNNPGSSIRTDSIFVYSTFVSVGDSCVGPRDTFLIRVLPNPNITMLRDTTYCHGTKVPRLTFAGIIPGTTFTWTRTGSNIGIPISGNDSIPMFMVMNTSNAIISNTISVTPILTVGGVSCSGASTTFMISAFPEAKAICKPATVYLNNLGNGILTMSDVNNGSIGRPINIFPSTFNCSNVGTNMVTLTVRDSCTNLSTCIATVTVLDTTRPVLFCQNQVVNLQPSSCETRFNYLPTATDNCINVNVEPQDTNYRPGKFISQGIHTVCYTATDNSGNTSTCCINVRVNSFTNPVGSLACADNIQVSLDEKCQATISADAFLVGGPYRCFEEYKVLIQLWNGGPYIDRDLGKKGIQLNGLDIGKIYKVTIIDTISGNSCWGKASVEDKLPPVFVKCAPDRTLTCDQSSDPIHAGQPSVIENCGTFTLTYKDVVTKGNCDLGTAAWIRRTWTAVDNSGNTSFCVQNITINYIDLELVNTPPDYNDYITPDGVHALTCDGRYDPAFEITKHLKNAPDCVDDYLLDHDEFIASGIRIPRNLGWNMFTSGPYQGHPHTESIYYPSHPDSSACWGSNRIIMWEGTGKPEVNGCENIGLTFSDVLINTSKKGCNAGPVGCFKIIRTWTMLDWCTSELRTHQQIIEVKDDEGPEITYPDSIELVASSHNCNAIWDVKDVWLKDQCSQELHYTLNAVTGTVLGDELHGYIVSDLSIGNHIVEILAEDCCGNISAKKVYVRVVDKTPPTAICQTKTVTSISASGSPFENQAVIKVESFDDGSTDNCAAHVQFKAIRMDELQGTIHGSNNNSGVCSGINGDDNPAIAGSQTYFDDYVKFCCNDVGNAVMVVFRVFDVDPGKGSVHPSRMNAGGDLEGRFSDCMIEVIVQNKSTPTIVAPADVVVSCDWWFDTERLSDTKDSIFGQIVYDLAWRKKIKTNDIVCSAFCNADSKTKYPGQKIPIDPASDLACKYYYSLYNPIHPDNKYELLWGFDGYILSGCGANFTITVDDQRTCGSGRIVRTFSTQGPGGQVVSATQNIWVVDCDPFWINSRNHCDALDDIIWPDCESRGTIIKNCGANTNPDVTGRPIVRNGADDHCALIAIEYKDQYFVAEHDACYTIIRTWTVIDWCQYDPNIDEKHGRWEFSQVIKVHDIEKPIVSCKVGVCEPASLNQFHNICYGHINLTATATDSCTQSDWLKFEYKIDLYNDGSVNYTVGSLSKREFNAGEKPAIRNNPAADSINNPFNASGNYPIGIHNITWYVYDGCENVGVCSTLFEIKDCKAPTPYCLVGLITVPMPSSGCVDVWAKDLDFASFDNCTPKDKLKFYFDSVRSKTSMRICCDDFVKIKANDEIYIQTQVWVEDEEGNRDYCTTLIVVQDNQNICPNVGSSIKVTGEIKTEEGNFTAQTSVDLYQNGQFVQSANTMLDGNYQFKNLVEFTDYLIRTSRNDNHLNGVSTADIVKIQKHILGKEEILSPYKLIAADVNNSKSLSTADIAEIRKLILGIIPTFTKVESWKFIPVSTQFEDPKNPWSFNTDYIVKMKDHDEVVDFVSIKMGDVNGNAVANLNHVKSRSVSKTKFIVEEQQLVAGQKTRIEFKGKDMNSLLGMQFTLNFNPRILQYSGVHSELINISSENVGTHTAQNGKITCSWNSEEIIECSKEEILFIIEFDVLAEGNLSNNIVISSDITSAECYDASLNASGIELVVRSESGIQSTGIFELLPPQPNPFQLYTDLSFRLPESEAVQVTIYDAAGRVLRILPIQGNKGLNSFRLAKSELSGSGIYYYQLDSKDQSATGKIVLID